MTQYTIDRFVEKEKEGIVFAKITKSFNSSDVHGSYFPYMDYQGKVVNSEACDSFKQSTIETLNKAFGFCHYGDQLTIVNFTKLAELIDPEKFEAFDNVKGRDIYDVNSLYVEKVLSLNEKTTIDIFKEYMDEAEFKNVAGLAASHMRDWKCDQGADYLLEISGRKNDKAEEPEIVEESIVDKIKKFFSFSGKNKE